MNPTTYSLAVHGGAGTIARADAAVEAPYHAGLHAALLAGQAVLAAGGSALDAVIASVVALEDCPLFNAGHGAVFNALEQHELDAGVMDGGTLAVGAVAGMRSLRNPVRGAAAVLREGRCVLLGVNGEDALAARHGLAQVAPAYFSTPHRLAQLRTVQTQSRTGAVLDHDVQVDPRFGTVGAVARDRHGHVAAATSTGGMTNKPPGRIGDSPVVGAGLYANDASCAVSATGSGEHFLRACLGHDVHARMVYSGVDVARAASLALLESVAPIGGQGGLIAIGNDGRIAMPYNSAGMYRGWVREGEAACTAIFDAALRH
jgi:L-asparaginase / beta-aspartyl-peptidase